MIKHLRTPVLLSALLLARQAAAQDEPKAEKADEQEKSGGGDIGLGLSPGTPQVATMPGGIQPSYGQKSLDEKDYRFDYHGLLTMPLRLGINKRAGVVTTEQQKTVLHAPPVVPDYEDSFNYTTVVPQPYAQLA